MLIYTNQCRFQTLFIIKKNHGCYQLCFTLYISDGEPYCGVCRSASAISWCNECQQWMCKGCQKTHSNIASCIKHSVDLISTSRDEQIHSIALAPLKDDGFRNLVQFTPHGLRSHLCRSGFVGHFHYFRLQSGIL